MVFDNSFSSWFEKWQNFIWNKIKLFSYIQSTCTDYVFNLRYSNLGDFNLSHLLNFSNNVVFPFCYESDTNSLMTSSSSSSTSVYVRVNIFRWVKLNNKINKRNIKSSGSYIGCNHALNFSFSKALENNLSLFLRNIAMKNISIYFEISI